MTLYAVNKKKGISVRISDLAPNSDPLGMLETGSMLVRRPPPQGTVGAATIVIRSPRIELGLGFGERQEPVLVQTLSAELPLNDSMNALSAQTEAPQLRGASTISTRSAALSF